MLSICIAPDKRWYQADLTEIQTVIPWRKKQAKPLQIARISTFFAFFSMLVNRAAGTRLLI